MSVLARHCVLTAAGVDALLRMDLQARVTHCRRIPSICAVLLQMNPIEAGTI